MLIKEAKVYILEEEPKVREITSRGRMLEKVPPALTGRYTRATMMHAQDESLVFGYKTDAPAPTYRSIIRLVTDSGPDAYTDSPVLRLMYPAGFDRDELVWQGYWFKTTIAPNLIGMDALDREGIWQKLWYGQRFNYTGRQVVDTVDTMLWDLASRHAKQPIHKLLGACVDKIPAYYDITGNTIDELVADAVRVQKLGYKGAKDHSYRGVKANIQLAKELRAAVGPDFALMHDCVWNYTYEDAVKVGRELERQHYAWMEEPLMDYDIWGLKKLSDTLDLPVLGTEFAPSIGGQPYVESVMLTLHALDIVRQRALGITGQYKLCLLAASFGITVHGSNPHVALAVNNEPWSEQGPIIPREDESKLTFQGKHWVENGYMGLAYGSLPVQEPDWDDLDKNAVVAI